MGLNWLDGMIILLYLAAITLFGVSFRKKQQSLHTYFLGGQNIPMWALSLSIVATETSTLTIIGTPAIAFGGDLSFLQLVMGYLVGRVFICLVLIPAYFKGQMYTAYELMQRRFGSRIKHATASMFLVTRALAEGVRVFAIATVVSVVLGTGDIWSIVIISCLTLIYTFEGGLTAVIWTDVVQLFIYIGGTLVAFFVILGMIPGGWEGVVANAGHKLVLWNFSFDFRVSYSFWAGVIGGAFLNTASHGVDQLIVQRLLAAKNERDSKLALLGSGLVIFFQFSLFLIVGVMLFSFYLYHPEEAVPAVRDRIFPTFVVRHLPHGVSGLVIAAILAAAMSNLSSALNSLASTTVVDFYRQFLQKGSTAAQQLRFSRWMTVLWGVILVGLAILSRKVGSVLEAGLTIASITYGSMLGVFLLGVFTRKANERGSILGMAVGLAAMLAVWKFSSIAFTWYVLIGTVITFSTGYAASRLLASRNG
ncbi:MAG: sodium solute transporter superfamily [Acidobacteria bacterium]|nr:sodium solute transporter superfamily [Acidobacteriota bacterium]